LPTSLLDPRPLASKQHSGGMWRHCAVYVYGAYHPPVLTITDRGFWQTLHLGWIRHSADEIIKLSDDGTQDTITDPDGKERADHEWIGRSKLRIDTRKFLMAKICPKIYGEKIEVQSETTHTHQVGDSVTALLLKMRQQRAEPKLVQEVPLTQIPATPRPEPEAVEDWS
jgi:hypothetical protein